jgi:hypothetical protein
MGFIGKEGWPAPKLKVATVILVMRVALWHCCLILLSVSFVCIYRIFSNLIHTQFLVKAPFDCGGNTRQWSAGVRHHEGNSRFSYEWWWRVWWIINYNNK